MQVDIPVRKDYRALKPAERQRFFYCLKMLSVLPPREANNSRQFYVAWSGGPTGQRTVRPLNIHDQFIASHQTCCEHGAPYFVYYHRHLLSCVEIALNYAEEVLLGGASKFPSQPLYKSYAKEFDAVFAKYQSIITRFKTEYNINGKLPQLAIHYWNATDYTQTIEIPQQIRERTPDEMDILYFAVNKHYAWNFNFAHRWFNETGTLPNGFQNNGYFQGTPVYYTDTERQIMQGTLNPRDTDGDNFFNTLIDRNGFTTISDKASSINMYRNFLSLAKTRSTMDVCNLMQMEIDTLFGSKTKKLHWINQAERAKMKTSTAKNQAFAYNKRLPHYQFAYSLFKDSNLYMNNYISTYNQNYENSMENCHNNIHNNLQIFMSDSQLSITNPLFFLYHSWIDFAMELKIRMIRTSSNNSREFTNTRNYLKNIKPSSVLDQTTGKKGSLRYEQYPVFEWAAPIASLRRPGTVLGPKDFQAAFIGGNYVLNTKAQGIRRSDELNQFYQEAYVPANKSRYSYFSNFSNFMFSYNYQVYDYDSKGNVKLTLMNGNTVPINSFIQAIYEDYKIEWNGNKTRIIIPPTPPQPVVLNQENRPNQQEENIVLNSEPPNEINKSQQEKYYDEKYLLRAIRAGIAGFATYSSVLKSLIVPIELQLTEKGEQEIILNEEDHKIMKEGLVICVASLFTRSGGALVCPNCRPEKELWISAYENLAEMNERLFCAISRSLNRELIFKIENKKVVQIKSPKLTELLHLKTYKPVFNTLKLTEGSRQICFTVKFYGKQQFKSSSIKIDCYSYSIQSGDLYSVLSKQKQNIECTIQFPSVVGLLQSEECHQKYVYRLVKGVIINGTQYAQFEFPITTFHQLIRYYIEIHERSDQHGEKYLDVTVKDQDYLFKEQHYKNNQYDI